jgi:hypothetical protein
MVSMFPNHGSNCVAFEWIADLRDRELDPYPGWLIGHTIWDIGGPRLGGWPSAEVTRSRFWLRLPIWVFLGASAFSTALLWYWSRKRYPPGYCRSCGYDLTGNESGMCPECGTPIPDAMRK